MSYHTADGSEIRLTVDMVHISLFTGFLYIPGG